MVKKRDADAITKGDLVVIIQGLETRLDAKLDGFRSELKGDIASLDSKVGALDSKVGALDSKVGALDSKVGALDSKVGALDSKVGALDSKVGALDSKVGALDSKVGALDSKIGALDSKVGALDSKVGALDSKFGGMQADIRSLRIESVKTNARMKAMENGLRQDMRDLDANVTTRLEAFSGRMETLWQRTITFPKILDEHGAALSGHERRLTALETRPAP